MSQEKIEMPKTVTPNGVYVGLLIIFFVVLAIGYKILGQWTIVASLFIAAISNSAYTKNVPGYHAHIILNVLNGTQRTIFQGLNFVLPWEKDVKTIDLRSERHDSCTETYLTKDALMKTRYVYAMRPDITGPDPSKSIILYASYEPTAIEAAGMALFSMMLSDYFGKNPSDLLRDKSEINSKVFKSPEGEKKISEFQTAHAVLAHARLVDADLDDKTQEYKDTIAGAKSIKEAIDALMSGENGLSKESATRMVKLMNMKNSSEVMYDVDFDAKGLENLQNFSILGTGGLGKDTSGTQKK